MKRILITLAIVLTCSNLVFAEDISSDIAEQKIDNEKSYAGFNFQKSPEQNCGKQVINNKGSWFNINIIINGKPIQINTDSNADRK